MTLVDAGPLIALIDRGQGDLHRRCIDAQKNLTGPLITSWACFTEAMYLLGRLGGWSAQAALWKFLERSSLVIYAPSLQETSRIRNLMELYQNVPMDLADATLVALAETLALKTVFTLDKDFYVYRINGKEGFEVFP
jgi:predicted nucleic acid-binding protein